MQILLGILLGLLQGLTEFLPVSSSGHLVIAETICKHFGYELPDPLFFNVAVHVATLAAVLVVFVPQIVRVVCGIPVLFSGGFWKSPASVPEGTYLNGRLALFAGISTLLTGVIGFPLLASGLLDRFFVDPLVVGCMLIVTGGLLYATRSASAGGRGLSHMHPGDAILIGLVQGVSLLPGISRSGSTISTGLLVGLDRKLAGEFSFVLAVPAIIVPGLIEARKLFNGGMSGAPLTMSIAGMIAAFVSGLCALKALMWLLKRGRIAGFAYYCWVAGVAAILLKFFLR